MSAFGTATRATYHEARRHFAAGGSVLVSEHGHELERLVTTSTTTHDVTTTTWAELVANVRMWDNRYRNQRFYVVDWSRTTLHYGWCGTPCTRTEHRIAGRDS